MAPLGGVRRPLDVGNRIAHHDAAIDHSVPGGGNSPDIDKLLALTTGMFFLTGLTTLEFIPLSAVAENGRPMLPESHLYPVGMQESSWR